MATPSLPNWEMFISDVSILNELPPFRHTHRLGAKVAALALGLAMIPGMCVTQKILLESARTSLRKREEPPVVAEEEMSPPSKTEGYRAIEKTVKDYNTVLRLAGILQLPFANQPEIVLFRKGKSQETDLDKNQLQEVSLQVINGFSKIMNYFQNSSSALFFKQTNAVFSFGMRAGISWPQREPKSSRGDFFTSFFLTTLGSLGCRLNPPRAEWRKTFSSDTKQEPISRSSSVSSDLEDEEGSSLPSLVNSEAHLGNPLGNFKDLPIEILLHIASYLNKSDRKHLALQSKVWKNICSGAWLEERKEYVRKFYPPSIIEAIGLLKLACMPELRLGDRLERHSKEKIAFPFDSSIELELFRSLTSDVEPGFAEEQIKLARVIEKDSVIGYAASRQFQQSEHKGLLHFNGHTNIEEYGGAFPLVCKSSTTHPHPFLFFIKPQDLQNNSMMWFCDAAGRHGLAFQYQIQYSKYAFRKTAPGIAIFHQVHSERPDVWICIEKHVPHLVLDDNGEISTEEAREENAFASRHFLFLHDYKNQQGPECKNNLAWLAKFSKGMPVGWLLLGKEFAEPQHPKLRLCPNAGRLSR